MFFCLDTKEPKSQGTKEILPKNQDFSVKSPELAPLRQWGFLHPQSLDFLNGNLLCQFLNQS